MSIGIIIIFGAIIGFTASSIRNSGAELFWNFYFGIAGSIFANSLILFAYIINYFPSRIIFGLNMFSITVDVVGAVVLIYIAKLIKNVVNSFRVNRYLSLSIKNLNQNLIYS